MSGLSIIAWWWYKFIELYPFIPLSVTLSIYVSRSQLNQCLKLKVVFLGQFLYDQVQTLYDCYIHGRPCVQCNFNVGIILDAVLSQIFELCMIACGSTAIYIIFIPVLETDPFSSHKWEKKKKVKDFFLFLILSQWLVVYSSSVQENLNIRIGAGQPNSDHWFTFLFFFMRRVKRHLSALYLYNTLILKLGHGQQNPSAQSIKPLMCVFAV